MRELLPIAEVRPANALIAVALGLTLLSCRDPLSPLKFNSDWSDQSHGRVAPNYRVVFPADSVNTIEIVMTRAQWAGVRTDMTKLWGFDFGSRQAGPCCCPCPTDEAAWVDVPVSMGGKLWKHVGFRLKGNSSLQIPWNEGNFKLPFRLNFDAFEESHPEIWNQRLYGFREVTMAPGLLDESLIRERLAADIFRAAGIPAARAAFYRAFIDFGEGPKYVGVYTMVELIEDTMLRDQFGEDSGNLYKPRSSFATFVSSEFQKQNNKTAAHADVQAMIAALNSSLRTTSPAQWRSNLEAVFNVDHFLKWLAVNNAMVSWDSYGTGAQNFYLYHHSTKKLTWIPWDQNFALSGNPPVIGDMPRQPVAGLGLSLTMNEVDATWPLIKYLIDDPIYYQRYRGFMQAFYSDVFTPARMEPLLDKYYAQITPYVVGPNGEQPGFTHLSSSAAFTRELSVLKQHVTARRARMEEFLR